MIYDVLVDNLRKLNDNDRARCLRNYVVEQRSLALSLVVKSLAMTNTSLVDKSVVVN